MRGLAQKVAHSRSHQRQRKRPGGRMIEHHERAYVARRPADGSRTHAFRAGTIALTCIKPRCQELWKL